MPYDPERHGPHRVVGPGFHERVFEVVKRVPAGAVTTYGDVAAALGLRRAARQVGYALAALPPGRADVPWHRVVGAGGRVSAPPGSDRLRRQGQRLAAEGVALDRGGRVVGFARLRFVFDGPEAARGLAPAAGRGRPSAPFSAGSRASGSPRRSAARRPRRCPPREGARRPGARD